MWRRRIGADVETAKGADEIYRAVTEDLGTVRPQHVAERGVGLGDQNSQLRKGGWRILPDGLSVIFLSQPGSSIAENHHIVRKVAYLVILALRFASERPSLPNKVASCTCCRRGSRVGMP